MSFTVDKEGHKHYRMKMDTGYIDSKGGDLNAELKKLHEKIPPGQRLQFSYVQLLQQPMKRFKMRIVGFEEFGLKYISITEVKTGNIVFKGPAFTLFGKTRCRVPRSAVKKMIIGEKYKVTIQK
jgi:hypothetical protein